MPPLRRIVIERTVRERWKPVGGSEGRRTITLGRPQHPREQDYKQHRVRDVSGPADSALVAVDDEAPAEEGAHRDRRAASSPELPRRYVKKKTCGQQGVEREAEGGVWDTKQRGPRTAEEHGAAAVLEPADFRPRQPAGQHVVVAVQRGGRGGRPAERAPAKSGRLTFRTPIGQPRIRSVFLDVDGGSAATAGQPAAAVDPEPLGRVVAAGRAPGTSVGRQAR